ncbi:MAG: hypothetical protein INQ03_19855 [Candidatus Heimdallarchaeota archaeon]|nr:hypothetical protein [Candidatus Heimdallarchaeota archaeon]
MIPSHDTFTIALHQAIIRFKPEFPIWQLYGQTGIGARITLAMNVRTGKDVGHPNSSYIWDIISTVTSTFEFLDYTLHIGQGYIGSRNTAAQMKREIPENVRIFEEEVLLSEPHIIARENGDWEFAEQSLLHDSDTMPFGPVALVIHGVMQEELYFPTQMFIYLIHTLERGEEPLELPGRGNYSAVSGWKAYARWMQSFSIPIRGIRHEYQETLLQILFERRTMFCVYLENLVEILNEQEKELVEEIIKRYRAVLPAIMKVINTGLSYNGIKEIYFLEQMALPGNKEIRNYIKRKASGR